MLDAGWRYNPSRLIWKPKANPLSSFFVVAGYFLSSAEAAKPKSTQQFFRVTPHDTEVGQGGTIIIPCEVGDRRGRVQWTKDGLTLGKPYFLHMQLIKI